MHRRILAGVTLAASLFIVTAGVARAEDFSAKLSGFNEVGSTGSPANITGAVFSPGTGSVKLTLNSAAQTLTYTLTYSGLSADVTQSHIHFGKVHSPGGVIVFFCTNLGNGPAGTQACPVAGGTVSGTITPASVVGPAGQNIPAGDWAGLVAALTSNTAYANVHTKNFPGGEVRGQVVRADHDDE